MKIDFKAKKGFICDMDGVLYHGNRSCRVLRSLCSGSSGRTRNTCF